jgi:hypothetical protein
MSFLGALWGFLAVGWLYGALTELRYGGGIHLPYWILTASHAMAAYKCP